MLEAVIIIFVLGMITGSFLNVVILRLPRKKALTGRSKCPSCRHILGSLDLVPVFSYLFLGGKCRYCQSDISRRYFYIELITGLLFVFGYFVLGSNTALGLPATAVEIVMLLRYFFIVSVLLVVFVIDFEHFMILDRVLLPASIALFVLNFAADIFNNANFKSSLSFYGIISALVLFLFFGFIYYLSAGKWVGFGDVKFAVFLGFATPGALLFVSVFLSFFFGAVIGLMLLAAKRKKLKSALPFGTFLASGTFVTVLFGPQILSWYFHLIGIR